MKISETKTKAMAIRGNIIQREKNMINNKILEQVSAFIYLGNTISHYNNDAQLEPNIQVYNRMNRIIRRHFGKQMSKETQLRLHNIKKHGKTQWSCCPN
jgi:hypothetical protein